MPEPLGGALLFRLNRTCCGLGERYSVGRLAQALRVAPTTTCPGILVSTPDFAEITGLDPLHSARRRGNRGWISPSARKVQQRGLS
jgi:hypothetical protein